MNGDTIYHLVFKTQEQHFYFGSISAIFDLFTPETLGVSKSRLWSFGITETHPYKNKICTIHKGTIRRKKTNRGVK